MKSEFFADLQEEHRVDLPEKTYGLLVEGILFQNMGYLNAYCNLKTQKISDLVSVLIQEFISKLNNGLLYTHTPVLENPVNDTQVSGLQASTNVNGFVNDTVNVRIQHYSQKTVNSVYRQKSLENIGKMLVKEMLSVQGLSASKSVGQIIFDALNLKAPEVQEVILN